MIIINKGMRSMVVTTGTYNQIYKSLGWQLGEVTTEVKTEEVKPIESIIPEIEADEGASEEAEADSDDEEEVGPEDVDATGKKIEDISEKPISQMSVAELKEMAKTLDIDISTIHKVKQLRVAIRKKL